MGANERRLISATAFRDMARKGAKAEDMADIAVFKAAALGHKALDGDQPIIEFICSNANRDREGDTISVEGWHLGHYVKNPVVLWAHEHGGLPIAKALATWVEQSALRARDHFVDESIYPFAHTVYRMVKEGFLNAVSVGFQPFEWDMDDVGVAFRSQELLEHSVCPVPAHPEALVVARSKGIDTAPLRAWAERTLDMSRASATMGDAALQVRQDFERLRVQADPTGRKLFAALGDLKLPAETPAEKLKAAAERLARIDRLALEARTSAPEEMAPLESHGNVPEDVLAITPDVQPSILALDDEKCGTCDGSGLLPKRSIGDPQGQQPCTCAAGLALAAEIAAREATPAAAAEEAPVPAETPVAAPVAAQSCPHGAVGDGGAPVECATCQAEKRIAAGTGCVHGVYDDDGAGPDCGQCEAERRAAATETPAAAERSLVLGGTDAPDPVRWNRSLSKAFDVTATQFPARSAEEALVAKYIGCQISRLHHSRVDIPSARMATMLSALDEVLVAAQVDDIRNITAEGREKPPQYEMLQLNSTRRADFLIDGIRFLSLDDVKICLRVEPSWWGVEIATYVERGQRAAGDKLLTDMLEQAKHLLFMKGEAFSLSGEFLQRTDETWDDLFLTEKNGKALQRIAQLLEAKGKDLESRGVLALGPPGTGKTKAGRTLMNMAKDVTFVWISARDFYRMGSFGGFTYAFDLGRELAPCILCFEDVDNWIGPSVVDLLKTEMDGMTKNSGVVTIMTTNYPELLPAALIDRPGRFHDVLQFALPDDAARLKMLQKWAPSLAAAEAADVVKVTAGYSGAHMRELCRFADIISGQEDVPAAAAMAQALEKLKEQRDLITAVQASGSRYRMPSGMVTRAHGTAPALLAPGERVLTQAEQRAIDKSLSRALALPKSLTVRMKPGEEAAELVKYQALASMLEHMAALIDTGVAVVDDMISDERATTDDTPEKEAAETTLEAARISVLLAVCEQVLGTCRGVMQAAACCLDDATATDPGPYVPMARRLARAVADAAAGGEALDLFQQVAKAVKDGRVLSQDGADKVAEAMVLITNVLHYVSSEREPERSLAEQNAQALKNANALLSLVLSELSTADVATAAAPGMAVAKRHVFLLDEEQEVTGIDKESAQVAVREALREFVQQHTGMVMD